jgi:hypothetical protein
MTGGHHNARGPPPPCRHASGGVFRAAAERPVRRPRPSRAPLSDPIDTLTASHPSDRHPRRFVSSSAYSPIPELNRLKEFEEPMDGEPFSDGFELFEYGNVSPLGPEPPAELRDRLIPFAQANHSGSFYALWKCDDRADLATLPVIFCGDEGELFIAARNLCELFCLLAVDDANDADAVPARDAYVSWLKHTFELAPAEDPGALYDATLLEYGRAFCDWWLTFEDEDSIIADLLDELEDLEGPKEQEG